MKFELLSDKIENPLLEKLKEGRLAAVDEGFSDEDRESIASFEIESALYSFDYYGSDEAELREKLIEHLLKLGENSDESVATIERIVLSATKEMLKNFDAESAWVTLRTSLPNDAFDTPRWHSDGAYFDSDVKVYKKVLTVKGAQTLFAEITDKDEFDRLQVELNENEQNLEVDPDKHQEEDLRIRVELMKTVTEINPSKSGESVIYLVGDEDSVVHSEPPVNEPRVFISVLVGTKVQIDQWRS
jgi:hypothetical protein